MVGTIPCRLLKYQRRIITSRGLRGEWSDEYNEKRGLYATIRTSPLRARIFDGKKVVRQIRKKEKQNDSIILVSNQRIIHSKSLMKYLFKNNLEIMKKKLNYYYSSFLDKQSNNKRSDVARQIHVLSSGRSKGLVQLHSRFSHLQTSFFVNKKAICFLRKPRSIVRGDETRVHDSLLYKYQRLTFFFHKRQVSIDRLTALLSYSTVFEFKFNRLYI